MVRVISIWRCTSTLSAVFGTIRRMPSWTSAHASVGCVVSVRCSAVVHARADLAIFGCCIWCFPSRARSNTLVGHMICVRSSAVVECTARSAIFGCCIWCLASRARSNTLVGHMICVRCSAVVHCTTHCAVLAGGIAGRIGGLTFRAHCDTLVRCVISIGSITVTRYTVACTI